MYVDKDLELSDKQSLSGSAASTNSIDTGGAFDIGNGEALYLVVQTTAAMGGTSPTLKVTLQSDNDSNFGSATDVLASETLSNPASGTQIVIPLPPGLDERYLRAYYTLGGTSPTGEVDAFIAKDVQRWKAHAGA